MTESSLERCNKNQLEFIVKKGQTSEKPMGSMFLGYSTIWRHLGHPQLSTGRLSAVWSTGHGPKWNLKSQCWACTAAEARHVLKELRRQ